MPELTTEQKGRIAELKAETESIERGWTVSRPTTNARYDLILEKDGKCLRAQVKWASPCDTKGSVAVELIKHGKGYTSKEIDCLLVYIPEKDEITLWWPGSWEGKTRMYIRLEPAKNNQTSKTNPYELAANILAGLK